ncbi:MAG: metallopeptidase family protein [Patescibacteria group bacterium]|jgi:predicted Zn-dependent protease with MMP-like domain|nr:metallopeptidase family protein [Patescibacteria group bacterium]
MKQEDFEKLVAEGLDRIPEEMQAKMDNVVIVIEDNPTKDQKRELGLRKNSVLFGLYEGHPLTSRGDHYGQVVPDKITIFKIPIEQYARDDEAIREQVANTVWHEIAHHFGYSEEGIKMLEKKKRNNKK